jgi:hypothetical protein
MYSLSRHWLIYLMVTLSSVVIVFLLSFFASRQYELYQSQRLIPQVLSMTFGQVRLQQVIKDARSVRYMVLIEEASEVFYVLSLEQQQATETQRWLAKYDRQGALVALKDQNTNADVVANSAEIQALLEDNKDLTSFRQHQLQKMVKDGSEFVLREVKRASYF